MGTGTILAALAAAGGGLYLMTRGGSSEAERVFLEEVKPGASRAITGRSGKQWQAVVYKVEGGLIYVNLYAMPKQFGNEEAAPILQYSQKGTQTSSRQLVMKFQPGYDLQGAYATALSDFSIAAPAS
jgi:hypothetical protein